jgi:SAM-dependent methyltransferase
MLSSISSLAYKILKPFGFSFEARLIEYDFVISKLKTKTKNQRLLDIGCCENRMFDKIQSEKLEIYGIDINICPHDNPITFIKANAERIPFLDNSFDVVTAVSTIEHIGLGRYGDSLSSTGDITTMDEIKRVLKPKGNLLLTVPFGIDTLCYSKDGVPLCRIYSSVSLNNLLSGFKIQETSYIVKRKGIWYHTSPSNAIIIASRTKKEKAGMISIALIELYKDKK